VVMFEKILSTFLGKILYCSLSLPHPLVVNSCGQRQRLGMWCLAPSTRGCCGNWQESKCLPQTTLAQVQPLCTISSRFVRSLLCIHNLLC